MMPDMLRELAEFSAEIGRDPEQVQAAGGNTSTKEDGLLWVKASGLWLADALQQDIFVPVRLATVLEAVEAGEADPVTAAVAGELNPSGLRPSIETTLHALLPHRIVVHTHSVRTIALAIRADAEALLAERLDGLKWLWVPYCKPGLPLTLAVAERLATGAADVLVLGNHGLVVGGATVNEAAALLDLRQRLGRGEAKLANFNHANQAAPSRARPRVLVVDDSAVIRDLLVELLVSSQLEVESAEDGQAALDRLAQTRFDLVVTDVEMPRVDGFELLARIRERFGELPVIMSSTRSSPADRQRAVALGADAYFVKSESGGPSLIDAIQRFVEVPR